MKGLHRFYCEPENSAPHTLSGTPGHINVRKTKGEVKEWLAVRKEAGARIDPTTAVVFREYGQANDGPQMQTKARGTRGLEFLGDNPMNQNRVTTQLTNIRAAPRCGAKTRACGACQCPAIRGRSRCKLHGGRSTGAPKGSDNGNFTTGEFTAEAIEERQWLRSVVATYGKLGQS